jgi:hypothetical protein
VLRRIRQTIVIPAICAAPVYVLVSAGSVSGDDVRSVLEIVEIEETSGPPRTILYRVDPNTGTARSMLECEDESIATYFAVSKYGDKVVIANVFGETIKPLLLAAEWTLNIFFNVNLPSAVQDYLDIVKEPDFSQQEISNVDEYAIDNATALRLMKKILAQPSFLELCARRIVEIVADGGYICPVTRVVVADTVTMGAGLRDYCLTSSVDDKEARIRPKSEAEFWTKVKMSLGVLRSY